MASPLYVAPDASWTAEQTMQAFAAECGRQMQPRQPNGNYAFVDGFKNYRPTLFSRGDGWVFGVIQDPEDGKE
jgi:hypothetical protein